MKAASGGAAATMRCTCAATAFQRCSAVSEVATLNAAADVLDRPKGAPAGATSILVEIDAQT